MSILSIGGGSSFQNNIYKLKQCMFQNKNQVLQRNLVKIRIIAVGIIIRSSSFAVSPSFSSVTFIILTKGKICKRLNLGVGGSLSCKVQFGPVWQLHLEGGLLSEVLLDRTLGSTSLCPTRHPGPRWKAYF